MLEFGATYTRGFTVMMPYGLLDLGQQWFRYLLVAWGHQAITQNNVDSLIGEILWHSPEDNFTWIAQDMKHYVKKLHI